MTPTTPEPFAYYNVGIEYHTKDKIIFHKDPTRNLEARWWGPDTPLYSAPDIEALTKERDKLRGEYQLAAKLATESLQRLDDVIENRDEYAKAADTQAMAHKIERDALAVNHKECVRCLGEALQDTANASVERGALMSAADSHKVVRDTLTARLNVLEAAAKLALDALIAESRTTENAVTLARILKAIAALRRAGVQ